jgi:hypothetical protein
MYITKKQRKELSISQDMADLLNHIEYRSQRFEERASFQTNHDYHVKRIAQYIEYASWLAEDEIADLKAA